MDFVTSFSSVKYSFLYCRIRRDCRRSRLRREVFPSFGLLCAYKIQLSEFITDRDRISRLAVFPSKQKEAFDKSKRSHGHFRHTLPINNSFTHLWYLFWLSQIKWLDIFQGYVVCAYLFVNITGGNNCWSPVWSRAVFFSVFSNGRENLSS